MKPWFYALLLTSLSAYLSGYKFLEKELNILRGEGAHQTIIIQNYHLYMEKDASEILVPFIFYVSTT